MLELRWFRAAIAAYIAMFISPRHYWYQAWFTITLTSFHLLHSPAIFFLYLRFSALALLVIGFFSVSALVICHLHYYMLILLRCYFLFLIIFTFIDCCYWLEMLTALLKIAMRPFAAIVTCHYSSHSSYFIIYFRCHWFSLYICFAALFDLFIEIVTLFVYFLIIFIEI